MKLPRPRFLALGLLLGASLHAGTRETAFQARAMLGPDVWSRVVRIENKNTGPGSRYPAEFYGLVVAFEDILWLYTELDGTQSLSLYAGRLAADQAELGPLLRTVESGLGRFEDVTGLPPSRLPTGAPSRGCFLASVARWQQLQQEPAPPSRARMIAYYSTAEREGHMVLEYWRGGRRYVFDPDTPAKELKLPGGLSDDPLQVARAVARAGRQLPPDRATQLDLHAGSEPALALREPSGPTKSG